MNGGDLARNSSEFANKTIVKSNMFSRRLSNRPNVRQLKDDAGGEMLGINSET